MSNESSRGNVGFIEKHGLWSDEQRAAAEDLRVRIEKEGISRIRIGWVDQHGLIRGKTLLVPDFLRSLVDGRDLQGALLLMDTTNNPVKPFFADGGGLGIEEIEGMSDTVIVPDPLTFKLVPWSAGSGWILSDMYYTNGRPSSLCTRSIMRKQVDELARRGYTYTAGLEVEFYITKLLDPKLSPESSGWPPEPPEVEAIAHGFQYLTDSRNDEIEHILLPLQDAILGLGLPLNSMEDEWGPGQCEFVFDIAQGLEAADNMVYFRTAIKQVCRRMGYHATFMARPGLPNFFSSGWHLHESLTDVETGENTFVSEGSDYLSELGQHFVGGVLEHANEASIFATPSVNGYKRYKPHSLAPTNASWTSENRGALIRVIGQPGDKHTHIENRAGEPMANPYLYMASQIVAGLDGVDRKVDPGPASTGDPYASGKPPLPRNLYQAVEALKNSDLYRRAFGDGFVDYYASMKEFEMDRFMGEVTEWEHREYFEMY
ncbi:glutamine synthetase family protein [Nocardioides endophyticus]|uniref:glutamine synthetase n=1 Tax=Nocardioides endophyticus TaxID=1353775 RepID=A0ABP8Z0W9_9ACTN